MLLIYPLHLTISLLNLVHLIVPQDIEILVLFLICQHQFTVMNNQTLKLAVHFLKNLLTDSKIVTKIQLISQTWLELQEELEDLFKMNKMRFPKRETLQKISKESCLQQQWIMAQKDSICIPKLLMIFSHIEAKISLKIEIILPLHLTFKIFKMQWNH